MSQNEAPFEIVFPGEPRAAAPPPVVVAAPAGDTTALSKAIVPVAEAPAAVRGERWLKVLHLSLVVVLLVSVAAIARMLLDDTGRERSTLNLSSTPMPRRETPVGAQPVPMPEAAPQGAPVPVDADAPPSRPEPEPEPKVEPKPEPKPEPKTEPEPEPKPEPKPEPAPEPKPEPKPEPEMPPEGAGNGHGDAPAPEAVPNPEDLQVQTLLDEGATLEKTEPRQAAARYTRVLELRPARTDLWKNIADLHLAAGEREEAARAYRTLLKHHPTRTDALNNLGALALQAGRYDEAARCFAAVVESVPSANAYYNFGNLHYRRDDFDRAAAAYRRALEYDARHERARFNLALALERQGRLAEAAAEFAALIPAVPDAMRERSRIEARMGGAEARRALEAGRTSSEPAFVLAVASGFRHAGELEKALALLDRAVELSPEDPLVFTNRGAARQQIGRGDEAVEDYEAAIRLDPQFADAHFNLGVLREERGLLVKALEHYAAAVKARPGMSPAHNNIGALYLKVNQPARALECFRRAVDADPRFAPARLNIAWAYLALDWRERALEELKAYVALVPRDQRDPAAVAAIEKLEKKP